MDVKGYTVVGYSVRLSGLREADSVLIRHQTPSRSRYARAFRESLAKPQRDTLPELRRCLEAQWIAIERASMRHAYHQRGMVYEHGEKSVFWLREPGMTRGTVIAHHFELKAKEVVDLFTYFIEKKQAGVPLAESYCRRGEAHLYQGAADLAIRDFDEALNRDPETAEAHHGRGNAYGLQGRADRAMADLEEALRVTEPRLPAALIDCGNAYRDGVTLEEAIRDFDAAIAIMNMGAYYGPIGVGDGRFCRAVARCIQEDWLEAKDDLKAARQEGVLVASSFRAICGGVPRFEADCDIRVPSVVATMLYTT